MWPAQLFYVEPLPPGTLHAARQNIDEKFVTRRRTPSYDPNYLQRNIYPNESILNNNRPWYYDRSLTERANVQRNIASQHTPLIQNIQRTLMTRSVGPSNTQAAVYSWLQTNAYWCF